MYRLPRKSIEDLFKWAQAEKAVELLKKIKELEMEHSLVVDLEYLGISKSLQSTVKKPDAHGRTISAAKILILEAIVDIIGKCKKQIPESFEVCTEIQKSNLEKWKKLIEPIYQNIHDAPEMEPEKKTRKEEPQKKDPPPQTEADEPNSRNPFAKNYRGRVK